MSGKKIPVPKPPPRIKQLPESWRADQMLVAKKAVSIACYIAEHGGLQIDQMDSFRNQNLIARIATEPDDVKAQQALDEALQRRAVG